MGSLKGGTDHKQAWKELNWREGPAVLGVIVPNNTDGCLEVYLYTNTSYLNIITYRIKIRDVA